MNAYWDFYEETARAIWCVGLDRVSHRLGGSRPIASRGIASRGKERDERWIEAAEETIWPLLYRWHYLRDRRKATDPREGTSMREREDPEFVAALSEANHSPGIDEPGWRLVSRGPDECICERDHVQLRVRTASLYSLGLPQENDIVMVRFPAERRHWMPLYYCTAGGMTTEANLRIYFNVKAASAPWLLKTISREFYNAGASYQLKLLNHPQNYTRPDAAVLYVPYSCLGLCRALVHKSITSATSAFHTAVPALTRRVSPGIAVADEPPSLQGRQMSFGEHRCRLVARGIARSHVEGRESLAQKVETICGEFRLLNLEPELPFKARPTQSAAADF